MTPKEKIAELRKKALQSVSKNPDFDILLKEIPAQIKKRTQLGKGVDEPNATITLAALSEKYKEKRKKSKSELSPETTPSRSNLTYSGEMLSSIIGERKGTRFTFFFKDRRKDGKNNNDIARWNEEKGRPFFNLADFEIKKFERMVEKIIKEAMQKLFD